MNCARIVRAFLFLAAAAVSCLSPTWSDAQIVAPDQSIGPQSEGTAPLAEGVIVIPRDEPSTKGFDQGFERPLTAPDRMVDGDEAHMPLRTPDQTDAGNVRESDERSALSF